MAKKVKSNVVIKDEELVPTTLGTYSNKAKSPIGLFIIIVLFLLIAIFMPNIQSLYDKYIKKNNVEDSSVIVEDDTSDTEDEEDVEETVVEKYKISTDTIVETDTYSITNIKLNGNTLELSITNKKSDVLNLDSYYLELYNDSQEFLERVKLGEEVLASDNSRNYAYTINSAPTQFTVVTKTENDYPKVSLNYDENGEGILTCSQGIETYEYIFVNDSLSKVSYAFNASNITDPSYQTEVMNKQTEAAKLNALDGITSTVNVTESGYSYIVNVDLSTADLSQINNKNYYAYKKGVNEVKFKAEARGFTCK